MFLPHLNFYKTWNNKYNNLMTKENFLSSTNKVSLQRLKIFGANFENLIVKFYVLYFLNTHIKFRSN